MSEPLKFHRYANVYPLMEGVDFDSLVEKIKKNGLVHPIVLYEGRILDGRNRYRACLAASVEPRTVEFKGKDDLDAITFATTENLDRRHLTIEDKKLLAETLWPLTAEAAKKRYKETVGRPFKDGNRPPSGGGFTQKPDIPVIPRTAAADVATLVNLPERTVERVHHDFKLLPDVVKQQVFKRTISLGGAVAEEVKKKEIKDFKAGVITMTKDTSDFIGFLDRVRGMKESVLRGIKGKRIAEAQKDRLRKLIKGVREALDQIEKALDG